MALPKLKPGTTFRFALDTFSIHSDVIFSLSIIIYNLAASYGCCRKLETEIT